MIDLILGADVLELENGHLRRFVRLFGRCQARADINLRSLTRLIVGGTDALGSSEPRPNHSVLADLYVEVEDGKLVLVATAYPKHWLLSIARELARRARAHTDHAIRVVDRSPFRDERKEVIEPPTGCEIDLEHANEMRLSVPQRETTKEDFGQLVGGILFFSAGVFFLIAGFWWSFSGTSASWILDLLWGSMAGLAMLMGGSLMVAVWRSHHTAVRIVITRDDVRIVTIRRGTESTKIIPVEQIADVRAGTEAVDEPALYFDLISGRRSYVLMRFPAEHLGWLATELRASLGLPIWKRVETAARVDTK